MLVSVAGLENPEDRIWFSWDVAQNDNRCVFVSKKDNYDSTYVTVCCTNTQSRRIEQTYALKKAALHSMYSCSCVVQLPNNILPRTYAYAAFLSLRLTAVLIR